MKKLQRYRTPPKKVFRQLGLGQIEDGYIKVIAGFRVKWRDPCNIPEPIFVRARVIGTKE